MRDNNADNCCQSTLNEFQLAKFSGHHNEPADFCRSQWQGGDRNIIWLLYRWILSAFFAAGVIGSLVQYYNYGTWFIYLTDWGFFLCFFICTYGAIVATIYYIRPSYFEPGSLSLKIYWISHFSTVVSALVITLVYWVALWPNTDGPVELYNVWSHACNSAFMLFDCFMVAFPTRLMHFIYPLVVGVIYGLFSLIYFWAGGTDIFGNRYIYFILDWQRPGLAVVSVCGCLVLILIFSFMIFLVYKLRYWIYKRCLKPMTKEVGHTQPDDRTLHV